MELYDFQQEVKETLLSGRSVVLQAPTGAGKTRAALAPFIEAFFDLPDIAFPRQALYSVPMRVLASQFFTEYRGLAESYQRRFHELLDVRLQTGEFPDDPKLEGDLIFATLDQTLSSALGVPYSLSHGQSNLNVGAVLGSYLIFDEFHLFPHQAAATTLQVLRSVGRITPFILMTATFTEAMLQEIGALLGAKPIKPSEGEIEGIESARGARLRKARRYQVGDHPIGARDILEGHDRRSLAVCNTVDRAIGLYDGLLDGGCRPLRFGEVIPPEQYKALRTARTPEERRKILQKAVLTLGDHLAKNPSSPPWAMLLHSRFERPHRQVKEEFLQTLWGRNGMKNDAGPSLIVVATQVVEVGLDISALSLHTELAPAASVFQRAGRCARLPGEQGNVYVYPVPDDKNGHPNYAPYGQSDVEMGICELTWQALREREDMILHFQEEQEVINFSHTVADRQMLDGMKQNEGFIWRRISEALSQADSSARRDLIRDNVENRTLLVCEPPSYHTPTEESPHRLEGFSLWQGSLRGKLRELKALQDEMNLDWALRYPQSIKDEEDSRAPMAYRWLDVNLEDERDARKEIGASMIFAVHPALISYDAERGFRLAQRGDGSYHSPPAVQYRARPDYAGYRLESYPQHIGRMRLVFEQRTSLQRRLAWVARRLAEGLDEWQVPTGLLERAVHLAFALHDLGKLDVRWQKWAADYQEAIGEGRPDFLIAHTHWEKGNPQHEAAQKKVRNKKPKTHAGEGADAGARILYEALAGKPNRGLYQATFTAIARHHSPFLVEANPYRLHPQAQATLAGALQAVGEPEGQAWVRWLRDSPDEAPDIQRRLLTTDSPWIDWWLYFLIERILRLCDGLSQEED